MIFQDLPEGERRHEWRELLFEGTGSQTIDALQLVIRHNAVKIHGSEGVH